MFLFTFQLLSLRQSKKSKVNVDLMRPPPLIPDNVNASKLLDLPGQFSDTIEGNYYSKIPLKKLIKTTTQYRTVSLKNSTD